MKRLTTFLLAMVLVVASNAEGITSSNSTSQVAIANIVKEQFKLKPIYTKRFSQVGITAPVTPVKVTDHVQEGEIAGVQEGKIVLMGGAGVNSTNSTSQNPNQTNESKVGSFYFDFGAMFMITQTIGILAAVTMQSLTSSINGEKQSSSSLFGGRIGARYYWPCFAPRFYTFAQVAFAFAAGSQKYYSSGQESGKDKLSQFGIGIAPGFSYFLAKNIALEMSFGLLGWSSQKRTNADNADVFNKSSAFDFFLNSKALTFGFCWWLGN